MKTTFRPYNNCRRTLVAAALALSVFSAVLLGGVSVQAGTTNYYWNVPAGTYTNDANWVNGSAPMGLNSAQLAQGGSINYAVFMTNNGVISYGDGGGGNSSGYTWTNLLGNLFIGGTNGSGAFSMTSGSLTISNVAGSAFELGVVTNSTGNFSMSGGSFSVIRDTATFFQDSALIGDSANSAGSGTFTINGGLANFLCGVEIGNGGSGTFNVNGGVVVANGWFGVGHGGTSGNSQGAFNLTAGVVYVLRNSGNDGTGSDGGVYLSQTGSNGVVNISGGTLYCTKIGMGGSAGILTNTTVNISGGSIYIGYLGVLSNGLSSESVNISGGTFHTADMLQISTSANAGATNTILSDGTNWAWAAFPSVNLTNSSFLVNGTAGPGYVTFAPETNRTITLSNNWSGTGGFLVNGPGTVSANTGLQGVGGGITVSNGILVIDGTLQNSSPVLVGTNGTLQPGVSASAVGVLNANNVTLAGAGSTLNAMINGATNSELVANTLTLDSANSVLSVNPLAIPTPGTTYVVAQYNTLNGTFATVTNPDSIVFTVSYANNEISLTVVSVGTVYNWISSSPADWSVGGDWDMGNVPNSVNDVVLMTNGVECDYSTPDTNWVGQLSIAPWDGSSGSLVIGSGSLLVSNTQNYYDVTIGGRSGANGVGGSGETPQTPSLGGGGTASLTMNGGTLTASRFGSGFYHQDAFMVGLSTNTTGTFTINNGTLNTLCGIEIGLYGNGIFNINGGTVIDNGWFGVGRGNGVAFGTGVFNITAGTLYQLENGGGGTVGAGSSAGLCLDQGCTNATVNISGGAVYSGDIAFSGSNLTPKPVDTLNISGGTIYIGSFGIYTNSETVVPICNISGGTFHTVDMLLSGGKGGANGAITNILSDGTNWTWTPQPAVNLTNSSFTVNGSSGPGYVTFAPEATRTITLNNQWTGVGGMVMNGPGELVLNGVDSFGSALTLNGGTLVLGAAQSDLAGLTYTAGNLVYVNGGSLLDPTITLPAGGSLTFSNTSTILVTNYLTGPANIAVSGGGVVNLPNVQTTGAIVQSSGGLVINGFNTPGYSLNVTNITNSAAVSTGALIAQGSMINATIGIGTNSALETGTTIFPGTLITSNVILNGSWALKLNSLTTPGGGINDLLICSNLTLNPGSSLLNILPLSPLSVGSYVIAEYSGTLTGTFGTVSNGTHDAISISYSGNQIVLNVTANNSANLTWAGKIGSANINWDVDTSSNWTNTAATYLTNFAQGDAVTFNLATNGANSITNRVSVTGLVLPASINITGGAAYTFSGTGQIGGNSGINYSDTNTSGIYTIGNTYTGAVNITSGVLQLGSGGSSWLGTSNSTIVNGGTLDLNGQNVGAEPLVLQGTGSPYAGTNGGAINSSASTSPGQSGGPLNIALAGNTTINASGNRWDIGINTLGAGGGSFKGNGYNLVKIGNQQLWMHEVGDIGVGNIDIQQGLLGFQFTVGMGISSDTVTVEPGATLGLFSLATNSLLNKQLTLNNNATLQSGGNAGASNNFIGPITLNGTNSITTSSFPLMLTNIISGTGGYVLTGTGPLYLGGVNTYSGKTVMGSGSKIVLESGASISSTPLIYMTPSASTILDNGTNTFTLNNGQMLVGSGSVIATNVNLPTGSTVSPGTNLNYGTLVFTNNLTLNGGTNILKISDNNNAGVDNDLIMVQNVLNLNNPSTFIVEPLAALNSGGAYTLVMAPGGINGSINNAKIVSTSPRYTMTPFIGSWAGQTALQINVTGNPASLLWKGYVTTNWDQVTANWLNLGTSSHDVFFNGDDPIFDDSTTFTNVVVTNNVQPAGIFMSNVVNTYTFSGGGVIGGVINMEGNGSGQGGTAILATTNAPVLTGIDSSFGTLVFDVTGVSNYPVVATITDNAQQQAGKVIFGGTNTVLLEGNNANLPFEGSPGFEGTMMVTNGVLEYTNMACLGEDGQNNGQPNAPTFSPLIVTNGGTLNFNGVAAGTVGTAGAHPNGCYKWIHISGSGFNGQGALNDSQGNSDSSSSFAGAFCMLSLDANAVIGSTTNIRYDQHIVTGNYQQVEGNTNNLTFIGSGFFFFYNQSDGDTHLGNIDVASTGGGRLAFQGGPLALGPNTNYLTVEPGAEVTFYDISNIFDTVPGRFGVDKIMWLKGNAMLDSGGNAGAISNNYIGNIWLTGTNLIGTRYPMLLWGSIMDSNAPGGFVLGNDTVGASGGDLFLEAPNSYSGQTIISNRNVHVGVNSSLGLSTLVEVGTNTTLDLSAMPVFNFGTTQTNQTMIGAGTVDGPTSGNMNFNAGGTLAIGLPLPGGLANSNTYTLTMQHSLVFNAGSTNYIVANKTNPNAGAVPVDEISGLSSVTLGGTLVITNFGTNFAAGDTLKLFSATTYVTTGFTTNNIVPTSPGPNLAWDLSSLGTSGTLAVDSTIPAPSFTNPPPIAVSTANNQLGLSWPAQYVGYYYLQYQSNSVSTGLSNNWLPYGGSIAATLNSPGITNTLGGGNNCVFYRLMTNAP